MKYLLAILLFTSVMVDGQVTERVKLFSDRDLYISGESIHFSALIFSATKDESPESRVLYCELVTPGGLRISGRKYQAENGNATGSLKIPEDLVSGEYYLKAYTRIMRNEGPHVYSYSVIRVVNPFIDEVREVSSRGDHTGRFKAIGYEGVINNLTISFPREVNPGETVKINIMPGQSCRSLKNLSISVIPELSFSGRFGYFFSGEPQAVENFHRKETRGITLSGNVKSRITGVPLKDIRVNLSVTGPGRDFMATRTDSSGRFLFLMPEYNGARDVFISTMKADSLDPVILVDNDFCSLPLSLPAEEFELSGDERATVLKMARNYQVRSYYSMENVLDEPVERALFYGEPDYVLYIDEYVELPTVEEYFNSLPAYVRVRKRDGEKYFKIIGPQTELTEIDPLVMVDLVAIDDPDKILALEPGNIRKIEIVNSIYQKGDQLYGGILNIVSKENDFAGINLPSSGVFLNYEFFNKTTVLTGNLNSNANPVLPDARNTIYWKTVNVAEDCPEIKFLAPETPGNYTIVIRGVNGEGVLQKTGTFQVIR